MDAELRTLIRSHRAGGGLNDLRLAQVLMEEALNILDRQPSCGVAAATLSYALDLVSGESPSGGLPIASRS